MFAQNGESAGACGVGTLPLPRGAGRVASCTPCAGGSPLLHEISRRPRRSFPLQHRDQFIQFIGDGLHIEGRGRVVDNHVEHRSVLPECPGLLPEAWVTVACRWEILAERSEALTTWRRILVKKRQVLTRWRRFPVKIGESLVKRRRCPGEIAEILAGTTQTETTNEHEWKGAERRGLVFPRLTVR